MGGISFWAAGEISVLQFFEWPLGVNGSRSEHQQCTGLWCIHGFPRWSDPDSVDAALFGDLGVRLKHLVQHLVSHLCTADQSQYEVDKCQIFSVSQQAGTLGYN